MNEAQLHQDIGALKAQVTSMGREIGDLKASVAAANAANTATLAEIQTALASARGGWKALVGVGSLVGALVALIVKYLPVLGGS